MWHSDRNVFYWAFIFVSDTRSFERLPEEINTKSQPAEHTVSICNVLNFFLFFFPLHLQCSTDPQEQLCATPCNDFIHEESAGNCICWSFVWIPEILEFIFRKYYLSKYCVIFIFLHCVLYLFTLFLVLLALLIATRGQSYV